MFKIFIDQKSFIDTLSILINNDLFDCFKKLVDIYEWQLVNGIKDTKKINIISTTLVCSDYKYTKYLYIEKKIFQVLTDTNGINIPTKKMNVSGLI